MTCVLHVTLRAPAASKCLFILFAPTMESEVLNWDVQLAGMWLVQVAWIDETGIDDMRPACHPAGACGVKMFPEHFFEPGRGFSKTDLAPLFPCLKT
jgi:hypothetical protein